MRARVESWKRHKKIINNNGIVEKKILLSPNFPQLAKKTLMDGSNHEYYLLVEADNKTALSAKPKVSSEIILTEGYERPKPTAREVAIAKANEEKRVRALFGSATVMVKNNLGMDVIKVEGVSRTVVMMPEEGEGVNEVQCYCFDQGLINKSCKTDGRLILDNDYDDTAKRLDIEPEIMKAIAKQESKRNSFWEDGQATILFERHKMWKCLESAGRTENELIELKNNNPKIVNKSPGGYGTYANQYEKLTTAKEINYTCAIKSCSWGKFQVMGFNYSVAFSSPEEMEKAVNMCEYQQFKFFIGYLENTSGMLKAMKDKDWEEIAKKYNGSAWKTTNPDYATNLKKYYDELK